MDYSTFRQIWDETLRSCSLKIVVPSVEETVDMKSMDRFYRVFIPYHFPDSQPHLFFISAEMSWRWDALLSSRFATTEEDLLTELLGRTHRPKRTEPPYLRVNVTLHATVPRDGFCLAPGSSAWRDWAGVVALLVAPSFPFIADDDPKSPSVFSWREEPEIQLTCSSGGQLYLLGVSMVAGQMIRLPRQWDDPDRGREPNPERPLSEFFRRVRQGLDEWKEALDELIIARSDG
jgi:hypothetical protein